MYIQAVAAAEYTGSNASGKENNMENGTWKCWRCGKDVANNITTCPVCGDGEKPIYPDNYCINPNCQMYNKLLKSHKQRNCELCGGPTKYAKTVDN